MLVQVAQGRLALVQLTEVLLRARKGDSRRRSVSARVLTPDAQQEGERGARTDSIAIRAWISYTCTVK